MRNLRRYILSQRTQSSDTEDAGDHNDGIALFRQQRRGEYPASLFTVNSVSERHVICGRIVILPYETSE
jgi:hypothetical protein